MPLQPSVWIKPTAYPRASYLKSPYLQTFDKACLGQTQLIMKSHKFIAVKVLYHWALNGATTLSVLGLFVTLSTNNTQHNVIQHNSIKCYYAECRIFIVMLSVVEPPQHLFILTMDILALTLHIAWHSYH
jgi:hypothetical protein